MRSKGPDNRTQVNVIPAETCSCQRSGAEGRTKGEFIVAPASYIRGKVVCIDREVGYSGRKVGYSDAEMRCIGGEVTYDESAGQVGVAAVPADETSPGVDEGCGGEGESAGGEGDATAGSIVGKTAGGVA